MTPIQALDAAIYYVSGTLRGHGGTPGEVIQRLSKSTREALSRLTSDELARQRVPEWVCRTGGRHGRARVQ